MRRALIVALCTTAIGLITAGPAAAGCSCSTNDTCASVGIVVGGTDHTVHDSCQDTGSPWLVSVNQRPTVAGYGIDVTIQVAAPV